ncbi:hypothetical protein QJQ45_005197 [Haematococcus lacustris]|nr:hypothetical protein QJQ45_005197 [Haematococcus lacustris]
MSQEADPALDFLSDAFDAQRALDTPGLRPPVPDVKPLDNLAKCRWLLPPEIPESLAGKDRNAKSGSEATREKHEQLKTKALSTIQRIEQSCTVSLAGVLAYVKPGMPQDCLRRWQQQQQRVRVVTRHGCGVRGVAEGQLVAYDTFMNLVLRDVSEQYTVMTRVEKPVKVKAPSALPPQQQGTQHDSLPPNAAPGAANVPLQEPAAKVPQAAAVAAAAAAPPPPHTAAAAASQEMIQAIAGPASAAHMSTLPPLGLEHAKAVASDPGTGGKRTVRWARKQERRTRQLGQVFVKGDSIVCVSCAQSATGTESGTALLVAAP